MDLTTLARPATNQGVRRVGRGGKRGKTSGRGGKGQTARAGNKPRPEWRDIIKKLPKRRGYGVNRSSTVRNQAPSVALTFEALVKNYKSGDDVTVASLLEKRLVRKVSGNVPPLKVLARGTIDIKLNFQKGIASSASAKAAILAAGGTID